MSRTGWIAALICWLAGTTWTLAEPVRKGPRDGAAATDRPAVELTPANIEKRLKQVEKSANLDEAVRKSLVEKYSTALEHLKAAEEHKKKADEFREKTEAAPEELEKLKAALKDPPPDAPRPMAADLGVAEMQQALAKAEKEYEDLQKELAEIESEPARRADRRQESPACSKRSAISSRRLSGSRRRAPPPARRLTRRRSPSGSSSPPTAGPSSTSWRCMKKSCGITS